MSGQKRVVHVTMQRTYAKGEMPPSGYLEWHEWAESQYKHGLRQSQCKKCSLWNFPQEMEFTGQLCIKCAGKL